MMWLIVFALIYNSNNSNNNNNFYLCMRSYTSVLDITYVPTIASITVGNAENRHTKNIQIYIHNRNSSQLETSYAYSGHFFI